MGYFEITLHKVKLNINQFLITSSITTHYIFDCVHCTLSGAMVNIYLSNHSSETAACVQQMKGLTRPYVLTRDMSPSHLHI